LDGRGRIFVIIFIQDLHDHTPVMFSSSKIRITSMLLFVLLVRFLSQVLRKLEICLPKEHLSLAG
jgi:hypothetical protein